MPQRPHDGKQLERLALGAGQLHAQGRRGAGLGRAGLHGDDGIARRHDEGVERRHGLHLGLHQHDPGCACVGEVDIGLQVPATERRRHLEAPRAVFRRTRVDVSVCADAGGLAQMQVHLLRMGDRDLVHQIGLAVILDEPELPRGAVSRKVDLELDREPQGLRSVEIGLFVDAAEFHAVDDERLVIRMQERALRVRQGAQDEEPRHGQRADEQGLSQRRHRAFVPAVPESLSSRAATSSASKEAPSLR